jgi:hypothetical protein
VIKYNQRRAMKKAGIASASVEPLTGLVNSESGRDLTAALLLQHGHSLDVSLDDGQPGRMSQLVRKLSDVPGPPGPGSQGGAASRLG